MSFQINSDLLSKILAFLSYLLPLMIGSMISGIFVSMDKNGKIRNSNGQFISFERAFMSVCLDIVLCAFLATFASDIVLALLYQYVDFLPAISCTVFLAFLIWFCHSFSYSIKKRWKILAFLLAVIGLNLLINNQKIITALRGQ